LEAALFYLRWSAASQALGKAGTYDWSLMTRIIGGIAGSRQLASPAKATRPTSDRIRESIFNRLASRDLLDGARVLDLYAGTGALALEAISRGASAAVLVEKDGKAAAVCNQNAQLIQKALEKEGFFDPVIKVAHKSVHSFLSTDTTEYDLVFIDPPYDVSNQEVIENLEALSARLAKNASVMVERSSRSEALALPSGFELDEEKSYGDTTVYWLLKSA
jgi:16S rRNA (guanine966-N2)-methyltransferase